VAALAWLVGQLAGLFCLPPVYMLVPQFIRQTQSEWNSPAHLLQMIAIELLYFLPLFCTFYWLVGRWPRAGVVVLLPPIGFSWLLTMEFVPENLTLLIFIFTWLWLAVTVLLLARWVPRRGHGWVLGLAALVIGLLSAFAGQFWVNIPRDGSFVRLMENFLSEFVPTLLPLMAILLLHTLRQRLVAANGRSALRHYRLLFWGIAGFVVSSQIAQRLFLPDDLASFQASVSVSVTAVFLLSLLAIGWGAWCLRRCPPGWHLLAFIVLFPFLLQAETIGGVLAELPVLRLSNPAVAYETVRLGARAAGLIWLVLAAWLQGRTLPPVPKKPVSKTAQIPVH
jgi:hypothetical protein